MLTLLTVCGDSHMILLSYFYKVFLNIEHKTLYVANVDSVEQMQRYQTSAILDIQVVELLIAAIWLAQSDIITWAVDLISVT